MSYVIELLEKKRKMLESYIGGKKKTIAELDQEIKSLNKSLSEDEEIIKDIDSNLELIRGFTKEEAEIYKKVIDSLFKPTGTNLFDRGDNEKRVIK